MKIPFQTPCRLMLSAGLVAGSLLTTSLVSASATPLSSHVTGEVLIRFAPSTTAATRAQLLALVKGKVSEKFSTGWMLVKVPSTASALSTLQGRKEIGAIQANYTLTVRSESGESATLRSATADRATTATTRAITPDDPYYSQQWALFKIGVPDAWKTSTGSNDIVVAIISPGVNVTHKDLAANIWTNTKEIPGNGIDDDKNGYIDDVHGYNGADNTGTLDTAGDPTATRVAGILGAVGNNRLGITGLNWRVKVLSVQDFSNAHPNYTPAFLMRDVDYILAARKHGVNIRAVVLPFVINTLGDFAEGDSYKALNNAGILLVRSANNGNADLDVKADPFLLLKLPNAIVVGASDAEDNKAATSSFGKKTVDIFAPGRNILTTGIASDEAYDNYSGTGASAAYVAGAAALLWSTQPGLSARSVKSRLIASAVHVDKLRAFVPDGRRLNVGALVNNSVHTIRGQVTGPLTKRNGQSQSIPLAGVSIYLDSTKTPSAITDAYGHYTITGVGGGSHIVKAVLSGVTFPAPTPVALPTDKAAAPTIVTVNIAATTEQSKLYVITGNTSQVAPQQDTTPRPDVDIYLNDSPSPVARSDKDGNFKIDRLPAGAYSIKAIDSHNGEAAPDVRYVYFPVVSTSSATVSFLFPVPADRTAPTLIGTNTPTPKSYTVANAPKTFEGTVTDASGVDYVYAEVFRYKYEADGTLVSEIYDPATKKWVPDDDDIVYATVYGKNQKNPKSFPWKFTFPKYDPGYVYAMAVDAVDIYGNQTTPYQPDELYIEFEVTSATTTNPTPNSATPSSAKGS